MSDCFHADRTAAEYAGDSFQVFTVLLVQSKPVDLGHFQCITGDREGDPSVVAAQRVVADPAEAIVGQPGRAAAPQGDLRGRLVVRLDAKLTHVAAHDLRQFLDAVEI